MTDAVYTLLSGCVAGKAADDYVFTRSSGNEYAISSGPGSKHARKPASQDCFFTICAEPQRETCAGLAFLKR
jgi:hypothetical protein